MNHFTNATIVVPFDFSEMSKNALTKALEIADSPAQLEVVHVTPYPTIVEPTLVWGATREDEISTSIQNSFRKETTDIANDLKFTALFGDPGSELAAFAKKLNAGLIVISSHGRTGLTRMLLGSVAERVVRLAPCPVLVLRD